MDIIRKFLEGKCDIADFMQQYMSNNELYEYIQSLIPTDALDDPDHEYWRKCILRSGLECYNFDVRQMLYSHCGLGARDEDQREIFNTIKALYLWKNPNHKCTNTYEDRINFYLDLEANCFGGPEVVHLVKAVADEFFSLKPKSARKKAAKARVEELFHVASKARPRWLHGPAWPMGSNSPMAFVTQKKVGNSVEYEFRDVDTDLVRIVKQFY